MIAFGVRWFHPASHQHHETPYNSTCISWATTTLPNPASQTQSTSPISLQTPLPHPCFSLPSYILLFLISLILHAAPRRIKSHHSGLCLLKAKQSTETLLPAKRNILPMLCHHSFPPHLTLPSQKESVFHL